MSDGWTRVSDVKRFLADKGQRRVGDHSFNGRIVSWPYCTKCGLLLLKNAVSRKAAKEACVFYE